jgi:hypothetical protein
VGLFGERVHVGTMDPGSAVRDIGKALDGSGIPCSPAQRIEPALEDVFVAAIASGEEARG